VMAAPFHATATIAGCRFWELAVVSDCVFGSRSLAPPADWRQRVRRPLAPPTMTASDSGDHARALGKRSAMRTFLMRFGDVERTLSSRTDSVSGDDCFRTARLASVAARTESVDSAVRAWTARLPASARAEAAGCPR